jgi:hypothetical protein
MQAKDRVLAELWRAMSGADLVTRWSAIPAVVGVAPVGLFWWLYGRREGNCVQDFDVVEERAHGSHLFRYRYVSSL